jgi:hypothetical protein
MGQNTPQGSPQAPIDPKLIERAQKSWIEFTKASTLSIIGVAAILVLMAIFLL